MKIKLSKLACLAIGAACALLLYMSVVMPDIEKPVTIAGFYFLLAVMVFAVIALLTRARGRSHKPYVSAGTYTLAFLYLLALRSINTLDWIDVAIVIVVVTLIRQLLIVPKNN